MGHYTKAMDSSGMFLPVRDPEISLSNPAGFSVSTYRFLSHELTPYLALFRNRTGPGPPFSPFGEAKQLVLVDLFLFSPPRAYVSYELLMY
jgi:hypothetical protein